MTNEELTNKIVGIHRIWYFPILEFFEGGGEHITETEITFFRNIINLIETVGGNTNR